MINPFILCMFVSVSIASVSQILLKKSAMKTYANVVREYVNPYVIGGYGLLFASMLLTIFAYSGMEYKNGPSDSQAPWCGVYYGRHGSILHVENNISSCHNV